MSPMTTTRAVARRAEAMNPTMRRLYLLDHGWLHDGPDWYQPNDGRVYSLAQAIRVALAGEGSQ